jgi:hypothetical protein
MTHGDRYNLEAKEEPTCLIDVRLARPEDSQRFLDVIARFAALHGLRASAPPVMASGRILAPVYDSSDLIVTPMLFDFPEIPAEGRHAQARLHVVRRAYEWRHFLQVAESFRSMFFEAFPEQVITWEEPNRGE